MLARNRMCDDAEPFGGCDILEPDHDAKICGMGGPPKLVKEERQMEPVQESAVSSTSNPPLVRIVKKTQMYIEPQCFSKTVTIDEDHTRKAFSSSQPSSSSWAQDNGLDRGSGSRKLTRLTLRIGKKQMTFKVQDIPPQNQEFPTDWEWTTRLHQAEATVRYAKNKCPHCSRQFATDENMRRHIANAHSRPFPCNFCRRNFSTKGEVAAHMRDFHSNERQHECPICKRRFRHASNFNQHVKLHSTGSRHFCNMCGKCFRTNDELAAHHTRCLALNEGDGTGPDGKPLRFECSYCAKPFHFRRDMMIHERVHTGEKPYECGYCGRAFTQSQALTSHIRLHTGEKPYSCQVCRKTFRDSSGLRKHEANHFCDRVRMDQLRGKAVERAGETRYGEEDEERDADQPYQDNLMSQMEMGEGDMEEVEEEIVEEGEIPMEEEYYM